MKITYKTKTKDLLPLISEYNFQQLMDLMPEVEYKSIYSMTIAEFADIMDDEAKYIEDNILKKEKRAIDCFGKIKHLQAQMKRFGDFMKKYDIPSSSEEKNARQGIVFPSFVQSILTDLVEFFHLRSFDQAEKYHLSDWLMIWQKRASESIYQYKLNKAYEQKNKAAQNRRKR